MICQTYQISKKKTIVTSHPPTFRTQIFLSNLFWAHLRRSAPETGLSAASPRKRRCASCGLSAAIPLRERQLENQFPELPQAIQGQLIAKGN
jgi:hypothetical protein